VPAAGKAFQLNHFGDNNMRQQRRMASLCAARGTAVAAKTRYGHWAFRLGCAALLVWATLTASPEAAQAAYGAVAVADTGNGYCTGESYNWATQAQADQGAIQSCEQAADYCTECVIRVRFGKRQCSYRTIGRNGDLYCVGIAPTPQRALRACQNQGCDCEQPIGNCNK
jgi:hypothetical protein